MVKYRIIAVGKMKESYYQQAVEEYVKRMSRMAKCEIIEIEECALPANKSDADITKALEKEGNAVLDKLEGLVVVLDIDGELVDSQGIAERLQRARNSYSTVTFVLGSSYGLSNAVKQRANQRWSLGRITLPHRLARVVLTEQLYRALTITNNISYHK